MLARTPPSALAVDTTAIISGAVESNGIKTKFKASWLGDKVGQWVVEITDHFGERTMSEFVEDAEVWTQIGIGVAVATGEARQVMKQQGEYGT